MLEACVATEGLEVARAVAPDKGCVIGMFHYHLDFLEPVCALSDIIVVLEWIVDDDYWTNVAIEIGLVCVLVKIWFITLLTRHSALDGILANVKVAVVAHELE